MPQAVRDVSDIRILLGGRRRPAATAHRSPGRPGQAAGGQRRTHRVPVPIGPRTLHTFTVPPPVYDSGMTRVLHGTPAFVNYLELSAMPVSVSRCPRGSLETGDRRRAVGGRDRAGQSLSDESSDRRSAGSFRLVWGGATFLTRSGLGWSRTFRRTQDGAASGGTR
ncbi:hypothetical protein GCM10010415_65820 [Streptomyces atrovirens]